MEQSTAEAGALYQALMRHFVHEDRIVYQSLPYLSAIQTATIAGSWTVSGMHPNIAFLIALLGAALTVFYLHYVRAARADRDVNEDIMNMLALELIEQTSARGHEIRIDAGSKGRFFGLPIIAVLKVTTILFVVIDVLIGVSFVARWLP